MIVSWRSESYRAACSCVVVWAPRVSRVCRPPESAVGSSAVARALSLVFIAPAYPELSWPAKVLLSSLSALRLRSSHIRRAWVGGIGARSRVCAVRGSANFLSSA